MKTQLITILIFFITSLISAQNPNEITYTSGLEGIILVKIETELTVHIKVHSKNELLLVTTEFRRNPEKAKGLKPIYNGLEDNTDLGCNAANQGDVLQIKCMRNDGILEVFLPKQMSVSVNSGDKGYIEISDLEAQVEAISNKGLVTMTNVTGPIIASSQSGHINLVFNDHLNQAAPSSITVSSANIDVTLPKKTNANLLLTTDTGGIYTDFSINIDGKDEPKLSTKASGVNIVGNINGGGALLTLRSSTGDIYLRKQN